MTVNSPAPVEEGAQVLEYCTVHPTCETTLHCNKCGRPMCVQCAVQTPVGYRCRECVRGIQNTYYTATPQDYTRIFAVCFGLALVGAAVVSGLRLPLLFMILFGLPVGGVVAEVALRLTSRRRGRRSALIAAGGAVAGGILGGFIPVYLAFSDLPPHLLRRVSSLDVLGAVFTDLNLLLFVGVVAFAIYTSFKLRS